MLLWGSCWSVPVAQLILLWVCQQCHLQDELPTSQSRVAKRARKFRPEVVGWDLAFEELQDLMGGGGGAASGKVLLVTLNGVEPSVVHHVSGEPSLVCALRMSE